MDHFSPRHAVLLMVNEAIDRRLKQLRQILVQKLRQFDPAVRIESRMPDRTIGIWMFSRRF